MKQFSYLMSVAQEKKCIHPFKILEEIPHI